MKSILGKGKTRTFHICIFGSEELRPCLRLSNCWRLVDGSTLGSMAPIFPRFVDRGSLHSYGMFSPSSLPFFYFYVEPTLYHFVLCLD